MSHLKISVLKISFLLILSLSIFSGTCLAQDQLASYKRAKTLIGYGNYTDAMNCPCTPNTILQMQTSKITKMSWRSQS